MRYYLNCAARTPEEAFAGNSIVIYFESNLDIEVLNKIFSNLREDISFKAYLFKEDNHAHDWLDLESTIKKCFSIFVRTFYNVFCK